ncbi:hypothetical protein HDU98_000173, partial [Podochytrium sp. JEL0797]
IFAGSYICWGLNERLRQAMKTGGRILSMEPPVVFETDARFFDESLEDRSKQDPMLEDILSIQLADPFNSLQDMVIHVDVDDQVSATRISALVKMPNFVHLPCCFAQLQQPVIIPASFAQATSLTQLVISNALLASVPEELAALVNLKTLVLSKNNLSVPFPRFIATLTKLSHLDLSSNKITGSFPAESFPPYSKLERLALNRNRMSGPFTNAFRRFKYNLKEMDFSHNEFNGTILPQLNTFHHLTSLNLGFNCFNGTLFQGPYKKGFKNLELLDVQSNLLEGPVPACLGQLCKHLKVLNLSSNHFSGPIPANLGDHEKLRHLKVVLLQGNQLTGPIPVGFSRLEKLQVLDVSCNSLSGQLPLEIVSKVGLVKLCVQKNSELKLWYMDVSKPSLRPALPNAFSIPHSHIHILHDAPILGKGGFATVYTGMWENTPVAIKVLNQMDPHETHLAKDLIEREALMWIPLHHPNIVRLWRVCVDSDAPFLVLELMDRNVARYIHENQNLSVRERLGIVYSLAVALRYLHSIETVHGDLKCNNLMIDSNGVIKLSDFGLSKLSSISSASKSIYGAARWKSPEEFRGLARSTASDIYSFGITVWELFSGQMPFRDINEWSIPTRVSEGVRPDKPKGMDETLWEVIQECWCGDSRKRLSASQVCERLEQFSETPFETQSGYKAFKASNLYKPGVHYSNSSLSAGYSTEHGSTFSDSSSFLFSKPPITSSNIAIQPPPNRPSPPSDRPEINTLWSIMTAFPEWMERSELSTWTALDSYAETVEVWDPVEKAKVNKRVVEWDENGDFVVAL